MAQLAPDDGIQTIEGLVSAYLARHGATDLDGVVALFAEDATLEDPVGSAALVGRPAIRDFYRATHARNGRLEFERIGPVLVGGDELSFHVRARLARDATAGPTDVIYVFRLDAAHRIGSLRAFF